MTTKFRTAKLAGFEGEGWIEPIDADGTTILEGRWRPTDGEDAANDLRERYLARETVDFEPHDGEPHEVYIASWFDMGHADALVIRTAADLR